MLDFLDDFQKKVLFAVLIILMIILSIVVMIVYKNKNKRSDDEKMKHMNCPDYWKDNSQGNGSKCVNTKHLGTCSTTAEEQEMNFSLSKWTGDDGMCHKRKWAMGCDLTWDGITNNPNIKCKTAV